MTLLVLAFNNSVVHKKTYATEEDLQGAAHYWRNCTDSNGFRKYRVYIASEYKS